jgi:hypothetical protein
MVGGKAARLARLEASRPSAMSERARAWLGLRPPLTEAELASEPELEWSAVDWSRFSPAARAWLKR